MEQPQRKQNPLETEPIGRLIRRYSIPTALTLMVNYLYNIVDQIFVGQGVGVTGMAATNVAFPLTIVTIALALMIGDGCAANMSLCLGRRQQEEADRTASHTVTLLVAAGVFLAVAGSLFARQIVLLFGATETAFQASLDYTRIIVWGLPFLLFSSALTAIIRADGQQKKHPDTPLVSGPPDAIPSSRSRQQGDGRPPATRLNLFLLPSRPTVGFGISPNQRMARGL